MKLACSSTAFDHVFSSGDLTQIEWLDVCARELASDGVVLDVRHFPRTDNDYLAQVKKMAVDLGLTIAAVCSEGFFAGGPSAMLKEFELASSLAAPLLATQLPGELHASWSEVLARAGEATSLAKRYNITLAVRNVPQTFGATSQSLKRLSKEADSAWLRFAPELRAFDAGSDPASIIAKTVLAWHVHSQAEVVSDEDAQTDRFFSLLESFRGFLAIDYDNGAPSVDAMRNVVVRLRTMLATREISAAL